VSDFDEINSRFKDLMQRARIDRSERAVTECLIVAGAYAAEITPIVTSTLINSQYRDVQISANGVKGEIGYGASYAKYVHEAPGKLMGLPRNPESDGLFWGPGGKPAFLSEGVMEMVRVDMENIMRENFLL
jgi:hypothetical protein